MLVADVRLPKPPKTPLFGDKVKISQSPHHHHHRASQPPHTPSMLTSRFLLFGASIIRTQAHLTATTTTSIPISNRRSTKLLIPSSKSLQLHRLRSTSAALDASLAVGTSSSAAHPWPEWIAFVDRLKSKGYIMPGKESEEEGESVDDGGIYKDMRALDAPCHSFARDRYDIFKSLSKKDIQTIVGNGCPNLNRKPVNSAKRLRAYVGLEEGDVCGSCNLRGSCDRAYVMLKESEGAARTVDVVRILLMYALDPSLIGGEVKLPRISLLEDSAKRLLSELVELSETVPEPPAVQPVIKAPKLKEQSKSFVDDVRTQNAEFKRGDWMCPKCNFLNFYRNKRCLKCEEDGPRLSAPIDELKKGDWLCPECNYMNFARNTQCLKCEAKGPKRDLNTEMKKGDWNCPQCGYMNFASNTKCKRCPELRPQRQLNPGEWECPSCNFLNFKKNVICLKCKSEPSRERPSSKYEEQVWRSPDNSTLSAW
uniref:RanBP2-type domain-containing protein n=1 Tax=Kalanchoe fedtschenkoi TaxID=63787 RepID=A0A7N0VHC0_KALFE